MFRTIVANFHNRWSLATGLVLVITMLGTQPGQTQDISRLAERIDRLEASVQEIRAHVLGGRQISSPSTAPRQISPSGNSANIDAAGLTVKLADLEREIRELTGRLEQAEFENRQLKKRMDGLVSDTDHRLSQVQGGQTDGGGAITTTTVVEENGGGDPIGTGRNAKTKVLGTIPATKTPTGNVIPPKVAAVGTGSVKQAPAPAPTSPDSAKGKYDAAFALLRARRFAEAEAGFQSVLDQHPKDALAGNAQYWIGETHYARKDYESAAAAFLTGFKKYRGSSKGPDNLLKLGITLTILGQKSDACAVFDELKSRYAKASASIIRRMKRERKKAGC